MTEKKRLQIGLMIHHLENEYASEILKGAIAAAEELDINLILLPGRGINAVEDDEKYSIYDYQYNVIYNYVSERNLDGLLVSVGTVGSYISREEMAQFLHSYDPLPLLTMEVEFPGYPLHSVQYQRHEAGSRTSDTPPWLPEDRLCFRSYGKSGCHGASAMLPCSAGGEPYPV